MRFLVEALADLDRLEPWPRRPPAKVDTLDVQPNLVGLDAVPAVRLADRDDAGLDIEAVAAARDEQRPRQRPRSLVRAARSSKCSASSSGGRGAFMGP